MRVTTFVPLSLALAALLGAPARGAEPPSAATLHLGDTVPAFQTKDVDGHDFDFAKARSTTPAQALEAVAAAAKARGAADVSRETPLDAVPGLKDADARLAFAAELGRPYGLLPDATKAASWKTAGDAASWLEGAARAPIVLVAWASECPACRMSEGHLAEVAAATGARVYLLACNWNDPDESIRKAVADRKIPFPVLIDRDLRVCGALGARKTPHVFVLDASNAIRYAGAIDSGPAEAEPGRRAEWLKDALSALSEGRSSFDVLQTTPKG